MNAQTITEMQLINLCTRIAEDTKSKPGEDSLAYLECFLNDCEFSSDQADWIKLEVQKRLFDLDDANRPVVKPGRITPPVPNVLSLSELREIAELFSFQQPGVGGKYLTDRERGAFITSIRDGGDMGTLLDYVLNVAGLNWQQRQIVVDLVAEF